MVVLSAAVITRSGKVLVARQFMIMSKLRIEGLLSAFPKLVSAGGEHTFIETENVRYLYQPLEQLYVLLITNKQSNIMEDLESLRLVAQIVPEFCHGHNEESVTANAFQLVFALDEVISVGYKENVTMQQIRTFTEMDSHEAELQKIIKASKEDDARLKSRQMAKEIEQRKQKLHNLQLGGKTPGGGTISGSYAPDYGAGMAGGQAEYTMESNNPPATMAYQTRQEPSTRVQREQQGAVGLRLGRASRQDDQFLQQLASEEHIAIPSISSRLIPSDLSSHANPQKPHEIVQGVLVTIDEVITIVCERDGALSHLEAVGTVKLTVGNPDFARIRLQIAGFANAPKGTRFQPHPKIDKTAWIQRQVLALKEGDKGFPIGSGNAAPILKYKLSTTDANLCPIQVTFWPSQENGRTSVTAEYQIESAAGLALRDCAIRVPCPPPQVSHCDGRYQYDGASRALVWELGEVVEGGATGTIEWETEAVDADAFFPLAVTFTAPATLVGLGVAAITQSETDAAVDFDLRSALAVQSFTLQ